MQSCVDNVNVRVFLQRYLHNVNGLMCERAGLQREGFTELGWLKVDHLEWIVEIPRRAGAEVRGE